MMMNSCIGAEAAFAAVRTADVEAMSREQLAAHNGDLKRLRSWLGAAEVRAARRAKTLEAAGCCESVESMASRNGGRSGRGARDLSDRTEVCDEMPDVEAALSGGEIGTEHVDAIAKAVRGLDADAKAEFHELGADIVAEAARSGVDAFARSMRDLAGSIRSRRDTQSDVEELETQRKASKVSRWIDDRTGMHHTRLELDPVRDAKLHSAVNAELARLRATDGTTGTPWAQMLVDAFVNTVTGTTTVAADDLADDDATAETAASGRVDRVPEITVLIDYQKLVGDAADAGICETDNGIPLPVATVRRLCCDAEILPAVLGADGEILDAGRSARTANRAQRRALRAMHRGCAHPDCTVGFDACRIHHVRWWWNQRGRTDIDNLLPLCERHHHLVHEGGWTLTMTPDRIATWRRPDQTLFHQGTTIDRRPTGNSTDRPAADLTVGEQPPSGDRRSGRAISGPPAEGHRVRRSRPEQHGPGSDDRSDHQSQDDQLTLI
jgi:hypothetical protein